MESVREYLVGVTCAALLCGILCSLSDEKQTGGAVVRLLCGVFLCLTLVSPLSRVRLRELDISRWDLTGEAREAADLGTEYARQAEAAIIKSRTEAYILDKARQYDLDLTVEVRLSPEDPQVPEWAVLTGSISPYAKRQLQHMMESDLGIPKENQQWKD